MAINNQKPILLSSSSVKRSIISFVNNSKLMTLLLLLVIVVANLNVVTSQTRVIGGITATRGLYPWYAYGDYYLCGASFLWNDLLIIAAHCTDSTFRTVYGGGIYLNGTDQTRYQFNSMNRHPSYSSTRKTEHDIAILKINGNYTGPIAHFNSRPELPAINTTMSTMGYGENNLGSFHPDRYTLQHVQLDAWNNVSCASHWTNNYKNDMHVCSGSTVAKDSCVGDSGSPLLLGNRSVIAGIVSFGAFPCAQPNVPAVNTRVSKYAPWLRTQLCFLTSHNPPSWCPKNPKCISHNNPIFQCTSNIQCCTNTTCNTGTGLCLR